MSSPREPAVAGQFYPGDPVALRTQVGGCLAAAPPGEAVAALAILVPHAGYVYSGAVAGATFASAILPRVVVILCPNHTGMGEAIAVADRGVWLTPLGPAAINEALAGQILGACPLARADDRAHLREHAAEVQLPFLQVIHEEFSFVPICVGTGRQAALTQLGNDLAAAIASFGEPVGILISSDMSHYIPAPVARARDMLAIEPMLAMDPAGLFRVVREHDISMCGVHPAVAGLTAAGVLGARSARLIAYANSGDTTGDYDRVVGYAGLIIS